MDILEIIEQAMADEKAGRELYRRLAAEAPDPESRAIFEAMARDEEKHYRALKERLTAIKLRRQRNQ